MGMDVERPDGRSPFDEQATCRECGGFECCHWVAYFEYWSSYDAAMPPLTASAEEHRKAQELWRKGRENGNR